MDEPEDDIDVRQLLDEFFDGQVVALAHEIGKAPSTVWRWREGETTPRKGNMALLRDVRRREAAKRTLETLPKPQVGAKGSDQ